MSDVQDEVAPFDTFGPPDAEIAQLPSEPSEKLLLSTLPPSLAVVLSRFAKFKKSRFFFS
jgi:hypothetical protein